MLKNLDKEMINKVCIVDKAIINKESEIYYINRQEPTDENDSGWQILGVNVSEEYLDNPHNFTVISVCDFVNFINPILQVIYEMPIGTDFDVKEDNFGKYLLNVDTNEKITKKGKTFSRIAFEENLKFISQSKYEVDTIEKIFTDSEKIKCYNIGKFKIDSGKIIVADPFYILSDRSFWHQLNITKNNVPCNYYDVILSIINSNIGGNTFIMGAKIKLSNEKVVKYERTEFVKIDGNDAYYGVGTDCGLLCICDESAKEEYANFIEKWKKENPDKNLYNDYFKGLFDENNKKYNLSNIPFLIWENPIDNKQVIIFESGVGDCCYGVHWGMDKNGKICELVIPLINPEIY